MAAHLRCALERTRNGRLQHRDKFSCTANSDEEHDAAPARGQSSTGTGRAEKTPSKRFGELFDRSIARVSLHG